MDRYFGTASVSFWVHQFGLRISEAEARNAVRNGVVKINGEIVTDPQAQYSLASINEIKCLHHTKIITQIG